MKISGSQFEPLRPPPPGNPSGARAYQQVEQSTAEAPSRTDSVQISDAGRQMSASQADAVNPERIAEIRQKVLQGAYNSLDVVEQVARRIITRGDS